MKVKYSSKKNKDTCYGAIHDEDTY